MEYCTVLNYLHKGETIGICKYDKLYRNVVSERKIQGKQTSIYKNGEFLSIYKSVSELEKRSIEDFGIKLLRCYISEVATGKRKQYKGYTFQYTNQVRCND